MNTKHKPNSEQQSEFQYKRELIEHILTASDADSLEQMLEHLLTPAEFLEISKRLQITKLLEAGISQRQIAETLGVGIATVTRGSRALKDNST